MGRHSLKILIAAAVALAALLYVSRLDFNGTGDEMLFPTLRDGLNEIESLRVTAAGSRIVATVERREDRWTVAEKSNYPADVGKLRRNLIALADAQVIEEKTANPELYDRLGVEDTGDPEAGGLLLEISGPETVAVIVGNTGIRGNLAYVRRQGEVQSLLVSADLDIDDATVEWLDREIIDIPASDIAMIEIRHADDETIKIEKAARDQTEFSVLEMPADSELAYETIANPIGGVLASLQLDDVVAAADLEIEATTLTASFATFDGLVVSVRGLESGGETWFQIETSVQPSVIQRYFVHEADAEVDDDPDAKLSVAQIESKWDKAERLSAELNAGLSGWYFKIPSFKADQLAKRMSDLLKSEE